MLLKQELYIIEYKSKIWTGPNTWGWQHGYRLGLQEVLLKPEFG